jgi:hypothetical protein
MPHPWRAELCCVLCVLCVCVRVCVCVCVCVCVRVCVCVCVAVVTTRVTGHALPMIQPANTIGFSLQIPYKPRHISSHISAHSSICFHPRCSLLRLQR